MRRFLFLFILISLAAPIGISVTGCGNPAGSYCNGLGYGTKTTVVDTVLLEPKTTGYSLAFGQTTTAQTPTATTCLSATVSVASYVWGTTNRSLVDISPSGSICGGTWNRYSAGGIPDYSICTAPATGGVAYITASGDGVTSNAVPVYVHKGISSMVLSGPSDCVSKGSTAQLDATAYDSSNNVLCSPTGTSCSGVLGAITFTPVDSTIVTIASATGIATAQLPGSTAINATVSLTSSTAGYFATCPPAKIAVAFSDGSTSRTISQGTSQTLVTTVTDTKGVDLTGLSLDYQSTDPISITVSSAGAVTTSYPSTAAITAVCQPTTCNNSPINEIGLYNTGKPVISNPVNITATGKSSSYLWMGSPESRYFAQVDLKTGTVGATTQLPYLPNSMVLDATGTNLYFGSSRELMIYTALTNTLTTENINVPGKVLAVSPDNSTVLINDQTRDVLYLYTVSTATYVSIAGVAERAAFTKDSKTLYAAGSNTLYVHNSFSGWSTYDLTDSEGGNDVAITVPGVGAFLAGTETTAHTFCYASSSYYPQGASVATATDRLAATTDGAHIIGAKASPPVLSDIGTTISSGACPTSTALTIPTTLNTTTLPVTADSINQVVTSNNSDFAFVTYTLANGTAGALLPYYKPSTAGTLGTIGTVTLSGNATAPLAGAFSADGSLFFVGTAGDNRVHYISTTSLTDTDQISPNLVDESGNTVAPSFLVARPRATN